VFVLQLIEAHESTLRALTLTANGSLLATASHKGTVIRVWDVATSLNVYEFRRGVERAQITCLAFSWDDQWLSCASDKGTTHIFYCDKDSKNANSQKSTSSFLSSAAGSFFSTSSKKPQPKSVCQIRGVPHPLSCAFIGDAPNLIAVAGWDADGNGVLLISEFAAHQEARRVAYHVLVKNALQANETEEERRRRRARGWKPSVPETPTHHFGNLQIGDLESEQNMFQTQTTDDDFCEVIMEHRNIQPVIEDKTQQQNLDEKKDSLDGIDTDDEKETIGDVNSNHKEIDFSEKDSVTNQDSVRTEPLEEDEEVAETLVQ
jgi:WD40 repeat protein